jgi:Cu/Ag efflux pump CusA
LEAIQTAYQGTVVAQTFRANQTTDIVVILAESARRSAFDLGRHLIRNAAGALWPLGDLAWIERREARSTILHDGGRRRQTVSCNPAGPVEPFLARARRAMADKLKLPGGYYVEFGGAAEQARSARRELLFNSMIAGIGILLLLTIILRHPRNLLLVLLNLPFALAGGILALHLGRLWAGDALELNMGALVGFVTLFGITTRNSIMLLAHYDHLVRLEGAAWNLETALRGASERLIPIAMTALVTALGLLPLALGTGEAGKEIEGPMAVVILGGLITSTLLNLAVLPSVALRYGQFGPALENDEIVTRA